mmetsp:Transcript_5466/g.15415  ORF Transcript_5466/g.15415 Transcript_5466/m.15415 type:complete len:221 (-) Transcript_5466:1213-1875(-)
MQLVIPWGGAGAPFVSMQSVPPHVSCSDACMLGLPSNAHALHHRDASLAQQRVGLVGPHLGGEVPAPVALAPLGRPHRHGDLPNTLLFRDACECARGILRRPHNLHLRHEEHVPELVHAVAAVSRGGELAQRLGEARISDVEDDLGLCARPDELLVPRLLQGAVHGSPEGSQLGPQHLLLAVERPPLLRRRRPPSLEHGLCGLGRQSLPGILCRVGQNGR